MTSRAIIDSLFKAIKIEIFKLKLAFEVRRLRKEMRKLECTAPKEMDKQAAQLLAIKCEMFEALLYLNARSNHTVEQDIEELRDRYHRLHKRRILSI